MVPEEQAQTVAVEVPVLRVRQVLQETSDPTEQVQQAEIQGRLETLAQQEMWEQMAQVQHLVIRELLEQQVLSATTVLQVQEEIQAVLRRLTGLEKQDQLVTPATREPTLQTQTKMQEF